MSAVVHSEKRMGLAYVDFPVYDSAYATDFQALRTLADIALPATELGDLIRVRGRACASNTTARDRGYSISWNIRLRMDPSGGNNWSPNVPPDNNDEQGNYATDGALSFKFGGNISPAKHHECREITGEWFARGNLAGKRLKLVSRAFLKDALSSERYRIDYSEIEVEIVRGLPFPTSARVLDYVDTETSAANASSYTFTMDLGAEHPDRKIIIPVGARHTASGRTITLPWKMPRA